jgi:short subunit dehydrogenase-like uncharacterized protein
MSKDARAHDLVLLGATGFTGGLTAAYLSRHLPADAQWGLAGRDRARLETVRDRLVAAHPAGVRPELLTVDVTDAASLRGLAESARVVSTTVGPYLERGEGVVAACAAAGTDYADITGEPEFVDRMWLAHHSTAVRTGARLVHCCGFEAVPSDLGVLFTVQQLPSGVPLRIRGVVRARAAFSGGTLGSAIGQVARVRQSRKAAAERRRLESRPEGGRRVHAEMGWPHRDSQLGYWLLPLPTIDPVVVRRSAAARPGYGPDFGYAHYAGFEALSSAVGTAVAAAGFVGGAQVPALRSLLQRQVIPGSGPSQGQRERSWFTVDLVGEGGGQRVHTRVSGGDPGYSETATMLGEATLSLAFDEGPMTAGQVTPAVAMGDDLMTRLTRAGMSFSVVGPHAVS